MIRIGLPILGFFFLLQAAFGQGAVVNPSPVARFAFCAHASDPPSGNPSAAAYCRLDDTVYVKIDNLPAASQPKDFLLVFDDRVMKGLTGRASSAPNGLLAFDLKRLGAGSADGLDNRNAWNAILSRAKGPRTIAVSVAAAGGAPYPGSAHVEFHPLPDWTWLLVALVLLLLGGFIWLAISSDIVRDGPSLPGGKKLSFSLGRCQMAWWTFIVVASFLYIWAATTDFDVIPSGALVLMGISSATALGAGLVDLNRRSQRQSLLEEQATLNSRLTQLAMALKAAPLTNVSDLQAERDQKQARLTALNTELASLPSPPSPSEGFLLDILRDETGISLHRFQMALWISVVLGIVFAFGVCSDLAMPDFSATLLALMGISSGTYVGFKIPDPPK